MIFRYAKGVPDSTHAGQKEEDKLGWHGRSVSIYGRVSRHYSDQDEIDDKLWEDFKKRVMEIIEDKKYDSLFFEVDGFNNEF